nr:hypothetical protein [Thermoanaerobaculia bacterium]HUM29879.1 hypothetical protein [Thermoanaerobaculia bacterium]
TSGYTPLFSFSTLFEGTSDLEDQEYSETVHDCECDFKEADLIRMTKGHQSDICREERGSKEWEVSMFRVCMIRAQV